ncbi:hypothetical protein O0L34_g17857 [Tuta absoluta]|nr:hypothetical protein O0L34_g17857 [Tuta absoluta]
MRGRENGTSRGPDDVKPNGGARQQGSRLRPIVVRLGRRFLRDHFIKQARVRRGADTTDLGLPQHTPMKFYINERLTKSNRVIFGKARDAAQTAGWRFVWTREGRIFARRTESTGILRLRSLNDVERMLTPCPNQKL